MNAVNKFSVRKVRQEKEKLDKERHQPDREAQVKTEFSSENNFKRLKPVPNRQERWFENQPWPQFPNGWVNESVKTFSTETAWFVKKKNQQARQPSKLISDDVTRHVRKRETKLKLKKSRSC